MTAAGVRELSILHQQTGIPMIASSSVRVYGPLKATGVCAATHMSGQLRRMQNGCIEQESFMRDGPYGQTIRSLPLRQVAPIRLKTSVPYASIG